MSSMKNFLPLVLLQLPIALFAQDTLYFDADWKESSREKHAYYRLLPMKKVGKLLFIQDFYKNGNLQMQGYALASDEASYVGDAYWYDENGYDVSTKQSINTSEVRELTYYHQDGSVWKKINYAPDGRIEKISAYLNGKELAVGQVASANQYSGVFSPMKPDRYYDRPVDEPELLVEVEAPAMIEMDNDEAIAKKVTYTEAIFWKNGQKAMEQQLDRDGIPIHSRYWDENGKLLSEFDGENTGTHFNYFTKNGIAYGVSLKEEINKSTPNKRVQTSYSVNHVVTVKSTFIGGQIAEIVRYHDGKEVAIQQYREGEPYDGEFVVDLGDKETKFTILKGQKIGRATTTEIETGTFFADGTYRNGEPFEGTFYDTGDVHTLLTYKNGQQDGKQTMFADYEGKWIAEDYEMKGGSREGYRRIYQDGDLQFESEYKNDKVVAGIIMEGNTQFTYDNGMLVQKKSFNAFQSGEVTTVEKYMNNELTAVEYSDFTIEEAPASVYTGLYKDGKPYEGYFKIDILVDNISLISFFEKGSLKYKYSFELLDQMENYQHYTYNKKTTYKDNQAIDGPTYELIGRERLVTSYYRDGKMWAFDINLFAMHYFNRLTVKLEGDVLSLSETAAPLQVKAFSEGGNIVAELMHNGEIIKKSRAIQSLAEGAPNSITQYYIASNKINTFVTAMDRMEDIDDDDQTEGYEDSFVKRLFYLFPIQESVDLNDVLQRLYTNFKQEAFNRVFETSVDGSYPVNESNYLGYLQYDQDGKPVDGLRFQIQDDKQVRVEAIADGKVRETKIFHSMNELLKDEHAAVRALEHRMLNDSW